MTKTVKKRLQAVVALLVTLMIMVGIMPHQPFNTETQAADTVYRIYWSSINNSMTSWSSEPMWIYIWTDGAYKDGGGTDANGSRGWKQMTSASFGNNLFYVDFTTKTNHMLFGQGAHDSDKLLTYNIESSIAWNDDTETGSFSITYYETFGTQNDDSKRSTVTGTSTFNVTPTSTIDHSEVIGRGVMNAVFYNYYYDQQVENNNVTVSHGQYKRPFAYFNTAVMLSDYGQNGNMYNGNTLRTPTYDSDGKLDYYPTLYAGEFWSDPSGYSNTTALTDKRAGQEARDDDNTKNWSSYYNKTVNDNVQVNQVLDNFVWSANLADRLIDGGVKNYNHVSQMMIDKTISLDPSSSTYMVPTAGGYKLPYFDSDFLYGNNVFGQNLGKVYSVKYPFYQRQLSTAYTPVSGFSTIAAGTKMYTLDSDKDSVKVTSSGITENTSFVYDGNTVTSGSRLKGFFPMNNPGDTEAQLQFGFGTRFDIPFTIGAGGKDADDHSMIFTFTGDDDVWVFIDGELVLDMGGGHKKATGAIDFSKRTDNVAVNGAILEPTNEIATTSSNTTGARITTSSKVAEILAEANNASNGVSNEHTLTMYYMERGKINSNMSLAFNFVTPSITPVTEFESSMPTTETFKVREVTDFSGINPGLVSYTKLAAENDVFSYRIKQADTTPATRSSVLYPTYDAFTRSNSDINSLASYSSIAGDTQLTGRNVEHEDKYIYLYISPTLTGWNSASSVAAWVWKCSSGSPHPPSGCNSDSENYRVVGELVGDHLYRFDFTKGGSGTGQVSDRNYALFLYKSSGTFTESSSWDSGDGVSDNVFITGDARKVNLNKKPDETNTIPPLISVENVYARSRNDYKYRFVAVSSSESVVTMGDVSYVWRDGYAAKGTPVTGDTLMAGKTSIFATDTTKGAFNLMYGTAETESSAEFINQINVGTTVTVEQADGLNKVKTPRQNNGNATPFEDGTRSVSDYYNAPTVAAQNDSTMQSVTLTNADSGNDKGRTLTYGTTGDTNFGITETWVNTPKAFNITVTKTLYDNSTSSYDTTDNTEFTVQVVLRKIFGVSGNDMGNYSDVSITSDKNSTKTKLTSGGTFTIKAGETITITGIPYGTDYSIQESTNGINTATYTTIDNALKTGTVTGATSITIANKKGTVVATNDQFTLTVAKKWSLLDKDALTNAGITSVKYQLQRTISTVTDAASYAAASWEDVGSVFTVGTSDEVTGANTTNVTWSKSLGKYDVKDGGGNVYTYRIIEYAQDDTALIYKNEGWYNGECQALYTFEESNTTKNNYASAAKDTTVALAIKNQYRSISSGQPLPKTGARGVYAIVTFGAFAITIAGVALLIYRKKLQTVNIYAVKGSEKAKE